MKVAIFGVWHVHARGYMKVALDNGEVLGFYEKNDALAEEFLGFYPDTHRFMSAEELLSSDAEGVIVCSSTEDHTEDMLRIAAAGKHIFTEKVLALTEAECLAVKEAVEKNGVRFTISYPHKFVGSCMTVKAIADSGELGKLNYARFRKAHSGSINDWLPPHFYNRRECGGGAMIDLGAHGMYILHWLFGMPEFARSAFTLSCERKSTAEKNTDRVEDNAVTLLGFKDGAIGVSETGFVSGRTYHVFEVHGERGYVIMDGDSVRKCTDATNGETVPVEVMENADSPILQFMLGKETYGCGIDEAIDLSRIMEMAYANA